MGFILVGVVFEVIWALGLKYAVHSVWGICGIVFSLGISSFCLIWACKKMEVGVVYAVFVGLGSAALMGIDLMVLGLDWMKLFLIITLLCAVIGIKLLDGRK